MPTRDSDSDPTAEPFDWEAIARYLAGESSPDEAREIRRWLDARPERAAVIEALDRSIARLAAVESSIDVESALDRVHARMNEPAPALGVERGGATPAPRFAPRLPVPVPAWRRPAAWLAAAAVVAIAAVGIARLGGPRGTGRAASVATATYTTAIGARDSLRLPDGTRVVLGPASRLEVAVGYGGARRDLTLHGEGYFDVAHDSRRPFVVHAAGASIEDIGTAFTVRADSAAGVRVAVTAGRVRFARASGGDTGVVLAAGDAATLDTTVIVERARAAAEDELAWTRGQLAFRDAPLTQVATELRRWYGLDLRITDRALAARRLTATFERENADQVLAVIGSALGIELARQGNVVVVRAPSQGGARARR